MKKRNILIASGLTLGVIAGATFGKIPINVMNHNYIFERYAEASEENNFEIEWMNTEKEYTYTDSFLVDDGVLVYTNFDKVLLKFDLNGNLLWEKNIGIQSEKVSEIDNGLIFSDSSNTSMYDFSGNLLWKKNYDNAYLTKVNKINNEIVGILTKRNWSGGDIQKIVKLDYNGNITYQKDINSVNILDIGIFESGIYIATYDKLQKYNFNGELLFEKNTEEIFGEGYVSCNDIVCNRENLFIPVYKSDSYSYAGKVLMCDLNGNVIKQQTEEDFMITSVNIVEDGIQIINMADLYKYDFDLGKEIEMIHPYSLADEFHNSLWANYHFIKDGYIVVGENGTDKTGTPIMKLKYKNFIDKSELDKLLEDVSKLIETDYSKETWKDLQDAIIGIDTLNTQEEIDAKVTEIQDAIDNLNVDRSALDKLLEDVSKLSEKDYSSSSWKTLQDAISGTDDLTKQSEINSKVKEIQDAIDNLDVDRSTLDKLLEDVSKLNETDYSSSTWKNLQDTISGANDLTKQSEIDNRVNEIQSAIDNLNVDRSALDKLLENVSKLNETDYSSYTWKDLQNVISSADDLTKQSEIDSKVTEIQNAIKGLGIDRSQLDELLAEVGNLVGTDYSTDSWNKLQDAVSNADTVTTQSQIQNAIKEINDAKAALTVDRSTLDKLLEDVSKLNEEDYSTSTWNDLQSAVTGAENLTKQSEIDGKVIEIQKAIDNLGIDRTKLDELLDKIEKMDKDVYTKDSLDNLMKVVDSVEDYTKQYEVDEKVAEIEEELKNLKLDPEKVQIKKGDLDKNGIVNANDAAIALDLYKYGNVSADEL